MPQKEISQLRSLLKFETLLNMFENSVTKTDFVAAFENLVKLVQQIEKRNIEAIDRMELLYKEVTNKINEKAEGSFLGLENKFNSASDKLDQDIKAKMDEMNYQVSQLKSGKDADEEKIVEDVLNNLPAKDIRDKLEGLRGSDRLDKNAIKGLKESLDDLGKVQKGGGRFGGWGLVNTVRYADLSELLDGTTKVFAVPTHRRSVLLISSAMPFIYRLTTDYTDSGHKITMLNNVEALPYGQTLQFFYTK